jgi:hypothetical protein
MDDHPLRITGHPFLDGVLWARGTRKTLTTAEVRVSNLPPAIIERIDAAAQEAGFETELKEVPMKHSVELLLTVSGTQELFKPLIKYGLRRLVSGLPRTFLIGYFTACSRARGTQEPDLRPEDIRLAFAVFHDPVDDALEGLASLGVTGATPESGTVVVDAEDYAGIAELEALRDAFIAEEQEMRSHHGGTAFEYRANEALERVDRQALSTTSRDFYERLKIVQDARRRLVKDQVTIRRERRGVSEAVITDYQQLSGKRVKGDLVATGPMLRALGKSYIQILRGHFQHSLEYAISLRLARALLQDVIEGAAPNGNTNLAAAFGVRGPTDDLAAAYLAKGPLAALFESGPDGLTVQATPAEAREILQNIEDRMLEATAMAMDFFRTLSFAETEAREKLEVLGHCGSCGEKLVLASGQTCTVCSTGLCQSCFVMYAQVQENPSKFAADERAAYCRVHANQAPKRSTVNYTPRRLRNILRRAKAH